MSDEIRVVGIDLALKHWHDIGSAILSFTTGGRPAWKSIEYGCIDWPDDELSPAAMARTIERVVRERSLLAVSLDGPQGWREPNATNHPGFGRVCEREARCPGRTGVYGQTNPPTQLVRTKFCIDVFSKLAEGGNARI